MTDVAWCCSTTRGARVCESSSGLLTYTFSLSERGKSAKMVEGRGVNKEARLIRELAAQCVPASWTPERAVPRTRTAGQKDMACSVCSPDIVHIWYGTLAPNSLLTPLPFTLYYFMLIEKYYIQHHLSLLPRAPSPDLNACVYVYRQVKTGGRVGDRLHVSVSMHGGVTVIGGVQIHATRSDLSIWATSRQHWVVL